MWAPTLRRSHARLAQAARAFTQSTQPLAAASGKGAKGASGPTKSGDSSSSSSASSSSSSVGGAERHPDAPVYSRTTGTPTAAATGGARRVVGVAQSSMDAAAMMRQAAAMAADASARDAAEAAVRMQQQHQPHASASASVSSTARPLSDAELRAEMRMADVSDPNFRFRGADQRSRRILRVLALLALPVLAYHLSNDVRRWADEQIEQLTKMYEAKYGKPPPKRDFFAPPPSATTTAPAAPAAQQPASPPAKAPTTAAAPSLPAPAKPVTPAPAPARTATSSADEAKKTPSKATEGAKKADAKTPTAPAAAAPVAAAATPAAAVVPVAATVPVPSAASKAAAPVVHVPTAEEKAAAAAELRQLTRLRTQLKHLAELERLERSTPRPVDPKIKAVADALNVGAEALPATRAIKELQQVVAAAGLPLPVLPSPPRWSSAPADADEARERLQQIADFRADYELAVVKQTIALQRALATELGSRIDRSFAVAASEFDAQLPLRLKAVEMSTQGVLEGSEMVELASLSRDVISSKSAEWSRICTAEMAKQHAQLDADTKDVLAKQDESLRAELEPEVRQRLATLDLQKKQIAALQRDLAKSAAIEETGARVHLLTNILLTLEEALRLDEHKQALFVPPPSPLPSQQLPKPKTGADLQHEWARLVEASRGDARLHALASSIPLDALGESSPVAVQSLSTLRRSFNQRVEPVVRAATFLPPTADADRSLPAFLYSRLLGAITFKEGYALRAPRGADDDAARLNNAAYYLNRERNLRLAVAELDALSERARAEAEPWILQAKQRVEVEHVFEQVRRHVEDTAQTYITKGKF